MSNKKMIRAVRLFNSVGLMAFTVLIIVLDIEKSYLETPAIIGLLVFGGLWLLGRFPWMERHAGWILLGQTAAVVFVSAANHEIYVWNGLLFEPFMGLKLMALVLALIAPPIGVFSALSFLLLGVAPLIQYNLWDNLQRSQLVVQEPEVTAMFVACMVVLWFYKVRAVELLERKAQLQGQVEVLMRIARLMVGAQHLANTPLQTMDSAIQLLTLSRPELSNQAAVLKRSLETVSRIHRMFSFADHHFRWNQSSFPQDVDALEAEFKLVTKL